MNRQRSGNQLAEPGQEIGTHRGLKTHRITRAESEQAELRTGHQRDHRCGFDLSGIIAEHEFDLFRHATTTKRVAVLEHGRKGFQTFVLATDIQRCILIDTFLIGTEQAQHREFRRKFIAQLGQHRADDIIQIMRTQQIQ